MSPSVTLNNMLSRSAQVMPIGAFAGVIVGVFAI